MSEHNSPYESTAPALTVRPQRPILVHLKTEFEPEKTQQVRPNPIQTYLKIDLLTRLIEHLKTL